MSKGMVIGPSTLVPIGTIAMIFALAFWVGGMAHEVSANGVDIKRVEAERRGFEAEIIQQMASQSVTMAEIQSRAAATEAKIDLLIQWERTDRLPRKPKF